LRCYDRLPPHHLPDGVLRVAHGRAADRRAELAGEFVVSRWKPHMSVERRFDSLNCPVPWSGCWIWIGYGTKEGYGRLGIKGKKFLAHRLSYQRFIGPIPDGLLVLHKCDEPSCVNPAHLFLGTDADNTIDKLSKGRQAKGPQHSIWSRGENHYATTLTEENVRAILADGRAQHAIASDYGVSQTNISMIKRRKTWKHVS